MDLDKNETGKFIRRYRKIAGLTQEELAQKVGISTMSVRRYESGERIASRELIKAIAAALECDPFSLMSFDMASDVLSDDINAGEEYKARIVEIMETVTTEGLRIGKDVFEAIAGNPKYQMIGDDGLPLIDKLKSPLQEVVAPSAAHEGNSTTGPKPPPESK